MLLAKILLRNRLFSGIVRDHWIFGYNDLIYRRYSLLSHFYVFSVNFNCYTLLCLSFCQNSSNKILLPRMENNNKRLNSEEKQQDVDENDNSQIESNKKLCKEHENPSECKAVIDKSAYTVVTEGKAEVLFPNSHDVFYNPVQEFNRDISIAFIRQFVKEVYLNKKVKSKETKNKSFILDNKDSDEVTTEDGENINAENIKNSVNSESREVPSVPGIIYEDGVNILEALAASGLRSIRYALEIPGIKSILANDLVFQAVESIQRNITFNGVNNLVKANHEDAALLMYKSRQYEKRFDVLDIDPYGSPTHFLDGGVQCVKDGGLLLVTCTDSAVLCGNASETCHAKYGSVSLRSKACHEIAIRIVLQCIESHANRYGRYIVPLLSVSVDFYIRVFVRIYTSQAEVKKTVSKLSSIYICTGCESFTLQPLGKCTPHENGKNFKYSPGIGPPVSPVCDHCGHKFQIGGPIWTDKLHDNEFVEKVLKSVEDAPDDFTTSKRIIGLLNVVLEELPDAPLYYSLDRLHGLVHIPTPSMLQFRSALLNAGYKVSFSHALRQSVKTTAPNEVIWNIVRTWAKDHPCKRQLSETSPAKMLLSKEPSTQVSFEIHPDANPKSRQKKLVRYQVNPEPNWGPKMKAKTSLKNESQILKRIKHQGKRSQSGSSLHQDLKQFSCKKFKKGKCELGNNCRYSHDVTADHQEKEETQLENSPKSQIIDDN